MGLREMRAARDRRIIEAFASRYIQRGEEVDINSFKAPYARRDGRELGYGSGYGCEWRGGLLHRLHIYVSLYSKIKLTPHKRRDGREEEERKHFLNKERERERETVSGNKPNGPCEKGVFNELLF